MVLIPSGHLKLMELQNIPSLDDYNKKLREVIAQATATQTMPGVTQQSIGAEDPGTSSNVSVTPEQQAGKANGNPDMSGLQNMQMTQPPQAGEPMANIDGMGTQTEEQAQEEGSGAEEGTLEDTVYKALTTIGVQHREWQSKKESIFTEEVDLNNKTRSGFYLIPGFTAKMKVTAQKAQQIAAQIAHQFGLESKIKTLGNWYKVEYRTVQQTQDGQNGSAFDEIPVKSRGGANKGAATLEGMLKARREELYQTMSKIANRTESK
jgi:hypothetical protein